MILLVSAAVAAAVQPGALHTFKDWTVGCDNLRACRADALEPVGGSDDAVMLTITRGAAPADGAALSVPLPDGTAAGARFTLKVDGVVVAQVTARTKDAAVLPLAGALLTALGQGQNLELFDAGGGKLGEASLAGLAASLRYIDDQQRRVGTVGALEATGSRPDADVPAPPAPPVIDTPPPSSKPPRTLSVAQATRLIGPDAATCEDAVGKVEPSAYRLDGTHSLVLVNNPCGNGAYNYFTSVYVLDETGAPRLARFDLQPGMGEPSTDGSGQLTNGGWDAQSRQLSSFEKGRGPADCGTRETYAWDGERFRLVEQDAMGECRAATDFIRVWTARASR